MALTDTELQDIVSRLNPDKRKQLLSQLGRQAGVTNNVKEFSRVPDLKIENWAE